MSEMTAVPQKDRFEQATSEQTRGDQFTPRVDIYETDDELLLFADVPGVKPENVDLRFENGELLLHGRVEPRSHQGEARVSEYAEGDFYRAFTIHESIDSTQINAECKNGVLTVHLPKAAAVKPRQIKVQA